MLLEICNLNQEIGNHNILPFVAGVLDRFCLKYDDTPDDRFEEHPLDPIVLSLSDAGL